ncbi:MAG: GAF domain-containing protein [Deltaproteobacteria bacterium]|nr:GAF domain-containing protein [Deltaproteobacteria bacterium]
MQYPWISPLIAAIASLLLGIFVYRLGPQNALRRAFIFLAVILVLWNLNFFALYSVKDEYLVAQLTRVLRLGAIFLPPAMFHLFHALQKRSKAWKAALLADYGIAVLLAFENFMNRFVVEFKKFDWGFYSVGGEVYTVFMAWMILNFCVVVAVLVRDYRITTDPRTRLQLRLWMVGTLIALPLGCTNFLPAYGIPFFPLGNLGNAVWAGFVAYAIVRHRLMDIDVVVTKGVAYAFVASVLVSPTFLVMLWLQKRSFGQIHAEFSFLLLVMLLVVGVLFPTLRERAEYRIGRSLFREKFEYREALTALARSIVTILDRDRLIQQLTVTLQQIMNLQSLSIVMRDMKRGALVVCSSAGVAPADQEISSSHPLVAVLQSHPGCVLRDEIEGSANAPNHKEVASLLRRNSWEACIPLTSGVQVIGFIALGIQRNLEAFSAVDLQLLETLGAEASIALENARLYEELKKSQDIIRRADRLSALGTLAAGIAHEVRNPLVSIQTFFQLAPDRIHDDEFVESFLPMAAGEVKRITTLINELLSFARSPSRALVSMDLNESVDRVVTLLEPEARKRKVAIEKDLSVPSPRIRADPDQMKQVLINLILNALQASSPGTSVRVTTLNRLSSRDSRGHQSPMGRVEVLDQGPGIPADQLDHIFVPFFTTKDKGTGLGLSIVHQIVSEHGGVIQVNSSSGGAQFVIDLPVDEGAEAESSEESVAVAFAESALRRKMAG